jgi:hypothetical protein
LTDEIFSECNKKHGKGCCIIIALNFYFGVKFAESTEIFLPFCSNYSKRRRPVLKSTAQLDNCAFNELIDEHSTKVSRETLIYFKKCRNDQHQTVLNHVSECGKNSLTEGNWYVFYFAELP